MPGTYSIKRFYHPEDGRPTEVTQTGLTLDEAVDWFEDPESKEEGVYFDGREEEDPSEELLARREETDQAIRRSIEIFM